MKVEREDRAVAVVRLWEDLWALSLSLSCPLSLGISVYLSVCCW